MNKSIAFPVRPEVASKYPKALVGLPPPRVWKPKDLADFLGVSISWVYKRTEAKADDPIPRIPGVGQLRFDTHSPAFQAWIERQLGCVDIGHGNE